MSHEGASKGPYFQVMAKTNPFEFIQQVRAETAKVTWPTRNETIVTTIMVVIMAIAASIFFLLADQVLGWGVSLLLGLGK
jgi:preprotein translocase subunit SecE